MKLLVALLDSLWLSLELSLHGEQVSSLGTLVERVGAFLGLRSGAALFLGIAGALLVSLLNETCLETGAPSSLSCADSSDAGSFSRLSNLLLKRMPVFELPHFLELAPLGLSLAACEAEADGLAFGIEGLDSAGLGKYQELPHFSRLKSSPFGEVAVPFL